MPQPDPARILKQHLQTDALLGVSAVPTPAGLPTKTHKPAPSSPADAAGSPQTTPSRPTTSRPPQQQPPGFSLSPPKPTRQQAPPQPPPQPPVNKLHDGHTTPPKKARLQQLADDFQADPAVQHTRPPNTNLVFGEGDVDAKLMFIGEGPGEQEDRTGRPFVGPAGELLDKMITAMGLSRDAVYIANVVKYRPPNNSTPPPDMVAAQGPTLAKQVAIIRPTALVALGGAATKFALQTTAGITRLRGTWAQFTHTDPPLPIMPTFHPAYLLRSYTPDNRKKVWADLQAVLQRIEP